MKITFEPRIRSSNAGQLAAIVEGKNSYPSLIEEINNTTPWLAKQIRNEVIIYDSAKRIAVVTLE